MIFYVDKRNHLLHRPSCPCATPDKEAVDTADAAWQELKYYNGCSECCRIIPMYEATKEEVAKILQGIPHSIRYEYEVDIYPQYLYIDTEKNSFRISVKKIDQSLAVTRKDPAEKGNYLKIGGFPRSQDLAATITNIKLFEMQGTCEGYFFPLASSIKAQAAARGIEHCIQGTGKKQVLYLMTRLAFWKVTYSEKSRAYALFHAPFHDQRNQGIDKDIANAPKAHYHRQTDVQQKKSPEACIVYVYDHDNARELMKNGGYQALPTNTARQKHYFNAAKKKSRRHDIDRTLRLIDEMSRKNRKGG